MSLKDKGNAWKLVYAALVMIENAPNIEEGSMEDEEIFIYEPTDLKLNIKGKEKEDIQFREIEYSDAFNSFVSEFESGKFTFPFTYQAYLHNEDIINTIEGFGLDVEQFWYAILAVYWLNQIRCVNVIKPEGSMGVQMQNLSEYMQDIDSFTITAQGKKKLVINDMGVIRSIRKFLDDKFAENEFGLNDGYSINFRSQGNHLESSSVQMWFSAQRYLKLFENLELPTIRARDSEVQYNEKHGYRTAVSGGIKSVSYNKMLLISRLMYFSKLTKNENFLFFDDSLKGIMKQYKNFKFNTYHPKYWF